MPWLFWNVTGKFEALLCYSTTKRKDIWREGIHKDSQDSLRNRHSFTTSENGHAERGGHPLFACISPSLRHRSTPEESPFIWLQTWSMPCASILDFLRDGQNIYYVLPDWGCWHMRSFLDSWWAVTRRKSLIS